MIDTILYIVAVVFFIIQAAPVNKNGWNFDSLAFAVLVVSLLV